MFFSPLQTSAFMGLWPNNINGSQPSNCDPDNQSDKSKIEDPMSSMQEHWPNLACPSNDSTEFWTYEWEKHGTCSESILDQHAYFQSALNFKKQLNLLQALTDAGIEPDGGFYSLISINNATKKGTGFTPGIECIADESGNHQLYEVYFCVDASGTKLIECAVYQRGCRCGSRIEFPVFRVLKSKDLDQYSCTSLCYARLSRDGEIQLFVRC